MKFFLLLFFLPLFAFAGDELLSDGNSGNWQLVDNNGIRWNAHVAYTTNGNGDVYTLGGLLASDNQITDGISGNHQLIDNNNKRWGLSVWYTTDGNGNVIPIPGGGGGGGGVTTLNSLSGALNIVAGSGVTVTPSGSSITIAASGSSGARTTNSVAANFVIPTLAVDYDLNVTASAQITLPDAVASRGFCAVVGDVNATTVTVIAPGAQTINGNANDVLTLPHQVHNYCANGGEWWIR
jgi:hypothetical protein